MIKRADPDDKTYYDDIDAIYWDCRLARHLVLPGHVCRVTFADHLESHSSTG